jgi:hypothetical protein
MHEHLHDERSQLYGVKDLGFLFDSIYTYKSYRRPSK